MTCLEKNEKSWAVMRDLRISAQGTFLWDLISAFQPQHVVILQHVVAVAIFQQKSGPHKIQTTKYPPRKPGKRWPMYQLRTPVRIRIASWWPEKGNVHLRRFFDMSR